MENRHTFVTQKSSNILKRTTVILSISLLFINTSPLCLSASFPPTSFHVKMRKTKNQPPLALCEKSFFMVEESNGEKQPWQAPRSTTFLFESLYAQIGSKLFIFLRRIFQNKYINTMCCVMGKFSRFEGKLPWMKHTVMIFRLHS